MLSVASRIACSAFSLRGRPRPRAGASSAPARSACFALAAGLTRCAGSACIAANARFSARSRRWWGSTISASIAPARAVAAATVSVVLIADVNAVSAAWFSAAPALPPIWSATTPACPTDSEAASAAEGGSDWTAGSMSAP